MKYIRTKDGIYEYTYHSKAFDGVYTTTMGVNHLILYKEIVKESDTIEELCDCFIKIKRKSGCKPFILKHDFRDLPILKEQKIKYPESDVYGAIHIENKGLIYVAKMNEKGELELL